MHFFSRRNASLALSLAAVGVLAACGDDVTVPVAPPAPVVVSITPQAVTLNPGSTATLSVQISGGDPTPTLASCASGAAGVATAAVSGSGCTVTAVAAGSTTITATTSTGQQASAAVTVNSLQAALGELTVSPAIANLVSGQNLTLVPNANAASNAVNVTYTYATAAAAIATVNGSGVVTAVAPGTTTITVTATGTGAGFSAATRTFGVTVNVSAAAPAISSLNVQPTSLSLATGSTGALTANATQPAGATAATYSYASANTAIATVTGTGANATVTAVAAGNTTITVTATAAAGGGFGASTVTQLIPVSVAAPASLTIETVTQGPIATSYVDDSTSNGRRAGIVTTANAQVNQPIDITAVRDQIQVAVNLVTNGQRVDSIVAFIANADGSNRRAAARQLYSNGQANAGIVNLFVNTADFAADFETGEADVLYGNGQKVISASVFTTNGTTAVEIQNAANNRQVVNFANYDGYAIQYVNPMRVADGPAGLNWRGGPGEEGTGRFSIVPVWYSGKAVKSLTMGMRQGLMSTIDICGAINGAVPFSRETVTAAPFALTYSADNGRNVAGGGNASTTGNGNIECGGYEHPAVTAQNIAAVVAGVDMDNNPAPAVTFADGYRFSSNVARPVNNRLDYAGPSTTTPDITRNLPAVTGWVNKEFNFNTNTAASTDAGVGVKANSRSWVYNGCTTTSTGTVAMADATGASVPECATNFLGGWDAGNSTTRGPYRVRYVELDGLDNPTTSSYSTNFGSDWTAPLIRWSAASVADTTILSATTGAVQFQAEFIDERGGFMDNNDVGAPWQSSSSSGTITTSNGSQQHFASRAAGLLITNSPTTKAVCINPNSFTALANTTSGTASGSTTVAAATGAAFQTMPNCLFRTQALTTLGVSPALDGYRSGNGATIASSEGIYHYATRVYDRAGNVSEVLRRRLAVDATAGLIANLGVPAIVTAASTPVLTYNAQDNVEIRATVIANTLPGIALPLVYPQGLVDARFNDNINSPIAQATTQLGVPAPTLLGVSNNLAVAPAAPIQTAYLAGFDVANRITPTITAGYLSQGVPALTAVPSAANYTSWGVLTSRAASFNAPEGLKAQLVSNTNVTNSPFGRVEFYRLSTTGIPNATAPLNGQHWQYLGSTSTAIPADQGNTRYWTYTLPDNQYASLPTAFETQQSPAVIGNDIIAIGVLASNGSGFVTQSQIGGSAINFTPGSITFTAPPVGFPSLPANPQANITVAGGTQGFNAVVTGVGILALDSNGGVYTVTANPVTINGVLYQPTNSVQVVNVPAGTIVPIPNNIVYQPQVLGVQVTTNLPAGGTISVSLNGPVNVTASIPSNGAIIPVPQAGNYNVVANTASLTISGQTYNAPVVGGSPANVVAGVPPVATITYASPAFSTGLLVRAYNDVTFGDFTALAYLDNLSIASNALVSPTAQLAAGISGAGTQITAASNTLQSNLENSTFSITNLATLFTTASIPAGTLGNTQAGAQVTTFGGVYSGSSIYNNANGTGTLTMRPAQIRITVTGTTSPALTNPTNWQLDATVTGPNTFTTGNFFTAAGTNPFVVNGGTAGGGVKIMTVPIASPGVGSYQLSIPNTFVIGGTTFTASCSALATGGNTAQVVGNNCLVSINAVYNAAQNITINYTGTP
jgi:uncharacterized protein YjdB